MINNLHQIKTIAIVGAEGSGKTVLIKKLADYFQVLFTTEYGKWFCEVFYKAFCTTEGFKTKHIDFHLIAQATFANFKKIIQTSQNQNKRFCLFDTELIFTNWFTQLQFPNCNWIENHFLPNQPIDLLIYLNPKTFVFDPIHYYPPSEKSLFSARLLEKYHQFRPQNSKLWIITETDYQKRFQIIVNQIKEFINEK